MRCSARLEAQAAPSRLLSLPTEVLTRVLRVLDAKALMRASAVSREVLELVSRSAAVWSLALPDMDPLHALGVDGMELRERFGSWRGVAHALGLRRQCAECGAACGTLLCPCDEAHCDEHCDDGDDAVFVANVWRFSPAASRMLVGAGDAASGAALVAAVAAADDYATLSISGRFAITGALELRRPVRIVGVRGGAALVLTRRCIEIVAPCVSLEDLSVHTTYDHAAVEAHALGHDEDSGGYGSCDYCDSRMYAQDAEHVSPALCVYDGGGLIAERVRATSAIGSAVVLEEDSAASFTDCTFNSILEDCGVTMCLGIVAKQRVVLSMHGCTIEHTSWGVFAGSSAADAAALLAANTFRDNEHEDVTTTLYPDLDNGQVVQPWRSTWVQELSEEAAGLGPAPKLQR